MARERGFLLSLILAAACFSGCSAQRTVCTQEAVADIVFLVDGSWSIGNENFEQIRRFLHTLVDSFDVGPDRIRIGLVQYSTTTQTEFQLNTFQNKSDILQYIKTVPYMGGGTLTGKGLDFLLQWNFVEAAGSRARQNVPQIAVVITDGRSQDDVDSHALRLRRNGIVLYAIGIKDADVEQLKEIANKPHSQHVYSVSNFAALQGISLNITQTLCATVGEAKRQVLQLRKECVTATKADVVFLVDGSTSIGNENFNEVRQFLRSVVSGLDIGPDKVRVGLAQYSNEPHREFLLKEHMDKTSLLAELDRFPYRQGGTETGKAINFTRTEFFTKEAGSRAGDRVPQILMVLTDGDSADDVKVPAQMLRKQGIIVFAIGVGSANLNELESIANRPLDRFRLTIDSFQALGGLTDNLLPRFCISIEDQGQALAEKFADIFFLVDSGIPQQDFQQVRAYLTRLVNQMKVGANAHHVGLAQYGIDVKTEFNLTTYKTKEDILGVIKRFRPRRQQPTDPRNLGLALRHASKYFFTSEAGGRADQGYRQYLIIFSGKESDDNVKRAARLIKSTGVTVIGMSLGSSLRGMNVISSQGRWYQSTDNIVQILRGIFEKQEVKEEASSECKGANVADIVFIVDESGSIGTPNFQLVRTFLHSLVNGLEVSKNRVRVGIVSYNDDPRAQVYLDTFDDKREMLNFINILPYNGGGTNTGLALNYTRQNVFVSQKGSRKHVQQVAVVITDGKSQDNVSIAAANLRRAGVTVYAVGVKDADQAELRQLASHPTNKHIFTVDSFSMLKTLEMSLQRTLCQNIIEQAVSARAWDSDIKQGCVQTDEADIFFLIDHSGSIYPADFYDMKKFIIEFLNTFRIGPHHVRVGVAKFADDPKLEFDLTVHTNAKSLEKAVEGIRQIGGGTETGKALDFMAQYFDRAAMSRGGKVREYLVVITDGKSSDMVKAPAERLRKQGVNIYAIGVKNADESELDEISGSKKRTFFVNDFDALIPIKNEIISDICSEDVCKDQRGDLLFLIDSSGSIESPDYLKMKSFMKEVVGKSAVGQNEVHIGVMQYSTRQQLEFRLDRYFTKDEMINAIDNLQQIGGGTHTGEAIDQVSQYFDIERGGRPHEKRRLVVITDGESQDEVKSPAMRLRAKGVLVYAIGVEDANSAELLDISGSPDRMFVGRDFDALKELENRVSLEICDPKRDCKKTERADIIFLVDGSTSIDKIPGAWESMIKFMEALVNQTTVGKDLTHFGFIIYTNNPNIVFNLTRYSSKTEILQAIRTFEKPEGDTHTGEALQYSLPFFNEINGGRAALGVPQILMLITDGAATHPTKLPEPAAALRDNGIDVFAIGIKQADVAELEVIAGGDKSKVFFVDNFDALKDLHRNISGVLCEKTKPVCEKQRADLVFLLDQSGSIGEVNPNDYMTMKNFTINLVNSFTVAKDFVRVGLAQFSDRFQHEFFLNEFYTSQSIDSHIRDLTQAGGGTKIGLALESIRKYFAAEHGGRKAEGISQNLVLITDGDSQDDVEEAASILRNMGVEVFAIGIGDVHDLELLQITGTPKRLFTVENFESLEIIRQNVIDTICKSKPEPNPPECSINIAIGFDISRRSGAIGETLVSGHAKLRDLLPDIVQDISTVKGLCCFQDKVFEPDFAYRVVNREGGTMYDFNFEAHSQEVLTKVMTTTIREPTFFNTAMLKSFEEKFRAESRAGVKVLVIFSDGLDEDVMKLEEESERLRKSGVNALLTVALEGAHNPGQLQMVEFGRGFGYKLPLSIGMPSIGGNILKQIDAVSDRECCNVTCKCSGHEGVRGLRGTGGLKGGTGQRGYPGFPGDEGVAGERGLPGPSGPQGVQGCPGLRGVKGSRGLRGNRGEEGEDGLDGVDGEQGDTGHDGSRGERGHPGNPGLPGIRGEVGPKGQRGLRGDPGEPGTQNQVVGPKGQAGNPGLPGLPGLDGRPGVDGEGGNPGLDGRRGSPGQKGLPGPAGSQGLPGIPGASGPQGSRGIRGALGPPGMPGLPGSQGAPGQAGPTGTNGRRGSNGQKGQPGDPGVRGAPGPQGPIGMPGQDGKDGYGPQGPKGVKGDPGFPGYPGLVGEDGLQGPKGDPGPKGNQGHGGVAGQPGADGQPGQPGHPGHMGRRGPPGGRAMTDCQLITYIRENCACSIGQSECPAQPTELVFGLDMSEDVTPTAFERQRSALLHLLDQVDVAESNCPRGARVAVVAYSAHTKYLIRFQDYRRKAQLLDSVRNIALERSTHRRQLGGAMRFVGNNVFKRVRSGALVRKVAVFLVGGPTQDVSEVLTATMEYRGLDIVPAIISLRNTAAIGQALGADDSGNSIYVVLGRDMEADLRKIRSCTICYDPCRPSELCSFIQLSDAPQQADMDLVIMMDDSREVKADEYAGAQQLLGSVVQQLAVSKQPRRADSQARVALVQQGTVHTAKPEFGLVSFQSNEPMRKHLLESMHQHGGSALLGQTLEFSLNQVLLKAGSARKKKVLLALVGSRTSAQDRAKLRHVSQRAKCAGVTVFVATVGDRYERLEVEELASTPLQQHLVHLGRLDADQQGYGRRFFRCFVSALNKGMNTYPPQSLKRTCDQLPTNPDEGQKRFPDGQEGAEIEEFFLDAPQERYQEHAAQQVDFRETLRPGSQQGVNSRGQAQCWLASDAGDPCGDYVQMWFFDRDVGACALFWFGGCGGNANRFSTEHECLQTCGGLHNPNVLLKPQRPSFASKDACFLRQDQGSCQNYTMMWFFDTEQNECSRFWFGGCGGNDNRFATQDECEDLCLSKSR